MAVHDPPWSVREKGDRIVILFNVPNVRHNSVSVQHKAESLTVSFKTASPTKCYEKQIALPHAVDERMSWDVQSKALTLLLTKTDDVEWGTTWHKKGGKGKTKAGARREGSEAPRAHSAGPVRLDTCEMGDTSTSLGADTKSESAGACTEGSDIPRGPVEPGRPEAHECGDASISDDADTGTASLEVEIPKEVADRPAVEFTVDGVSQQQIPCGAIAPAASNCGSAVIDSASDSVGGNSSKRGGTKSKRKQSKRRAPQGAQVFTGDLSQDQTGIQQGGSQGTQVSSGVQQDVSDETRGSPERCRRDAEERKFEQSKDVSTAKAASCTSGERSTAAEPLFQRGMSPLAPPTNPETQRLVQEGIHAFPTDRKKAAVLLRLAARKGFLPAYILLAHLAQSVEEALMIDALVSLLTEKDSGKHVPRELLHQCATQLAAALRDPVHVEEVRKRRQDLGRIAQEYPILHAALLAEPVQRQERQSHGPRAKASPQSHRKEDGSAFDKNSVERLEQQCGPPRLNESERTCRREPHGHVDTLPAERSIGKHSLSSPACEGSWTEGDDSWNFTADLPQASFAQGSLLISRNRIQLRCQSSLVIDVAVPECADVRNAKAWSKSRRLVVRVPAMPQRRGSFIHDLD